MLSILVNERLGPELIPVYSSQPAGDKYPPGGRLPLLSAGSGVTFPAATASPPFGRY